MTIDEYITDHLEAEPEYLRTIFRNTNLKLLNPRMQSGHYQGRLLKMFTRMLCPHHILEIGTFSAYSTLCLAEGLSPDGHIDTIEIDDELEDFINDNISLSPFADRITLHIGDALQIAPTLGKQFDLVFVDGNKRHYRQYLDMVLPLLSERGVVLADNTLWSGKVVEKPTSGDYQTKEIIAFNRYVAQNSAIEQIILPVRDGLTIIRKK
ncbi:MAG: O-methyltransferase [Bacteroidetes bacterium]|nr:MAG: O-methyltransferase [Bacteroidota bacterium]